MAEAYELTINVDLVREHFNATDDREWTNDEVVEWLRETGFKLQGRTWIAEELSIDALDRSEYRILRRL